MATAANRLDAALDYAGRGWPVILLHGMVDGACTCGRVCNCALADNNPKAAHGDDCQVCHSPGKHPRTKNGLKDASTDTDLIRRWYEKRPTANVGLLTGVAFDVIDCDDPSHMAWFSVCDELGIDLDAPMVRTGSGGLHVFVAPSGCGNRARWRPNLDYRGAGGYVVAPPSVHLSGSEYLWL